MGAHPHAADAARVKVELAEVFARHGAAYRAAHALAPVQSRALRAIAACRTAALGGQLAQCDGCGAQRYIYHSCRNRHCPKCQTLAKERWLAARRAELLPVPYCHLVFTLPHALNALAQGNPRVIYGLLFASVSATLIEFGANPRWLGGEIAATLILHTWGQTLTQHLHLHCLVAAGALHADGHWIGSRRGFLFPVTALSQLFRGKFLAALTRAVDTGALNFSGATATLAAASARHRWFGALYEQAWVVYAKPPFGGPQQVLDYLGRYTHRVAISNNRLAAVAHDRVSFRYKDYAHGNRRKTLTLEPDEFIRRFLLHVLPRGLHCASAITDSSPIAPRRSSWHWHARRSINHHRLHTPHHPSRSKPSGCAWLRSTSSAARTVTPGACCSSARSIHRLRAGRRRHLAHEPHSYCQPPACAVFSTREPPGCAPETCVDPA